MASRDAMLWGVTLPSCFSVRLTYITTKSRSAQCGHLTPFFPRHKLELDASILLGLELRDPDRQTSDLAVTAECVRLFCS